MEEFIDKKYITDIYRQIQTAVKKYGSFHKVLFHLHTPASFDYKMLEETEDGRQLKDFSKEELIDIFSQTSNDEIIYNIDSILSNKVVLKLDIKNDVNQLEFRIFNYTDKCSIIPCLKV